MNPRIRRLGLAAAALAALPWAATASACDCATCQAAQAAAMQNALTAIDAQKPIPANSVAQVYKNPQCENQLGTYTQITQQLQQLAGSFGNSQAAQQAQQALQALQQIFGSAQSACGGSGGALSRNAGAVNWPSLANPSQIQNDINAAQGGNANAVFQNLFQ